MLLGCPLFEEEIETANDQVKLIETLANIIVVSLENKRLFKRQLEQSQLKKEMDLAAEVQQLLIPTNWIFHQALKPMDITSPMVR